MTDRFVSVPDSLELPADVKVPSTRLSDSTAAGRALLTGADAAAQRSSLGLGTAAEHAHGDYATAAQGAKADASDVDQITLTGDLVLTLPVGHPAGQVYRCAITQPATPPTGYTVTYGGQPVSVDLTAGACTTVELHPVGGGYVVRYPLAPTTAGRAIIDATDATAQRAALGLGTAATKAAGVAGGVASLTADGSVMPANTNSNTAIGEGTLTGVTTGSYNMAVGKNALQSDSTGQMNVAIGMNALFACTTGSQNIAIGNSAVEDVTTGGHNVGIGVNALANATGSMNVGIGYAALRNLIAGNGNVAIGEEALTTLTNPAAGTINTAVGYFALKALTTGVGNTAIGEKTLMGLTTGTANTALGQLSLSGATTGQQNVALGHGTLYGLTSGSNNTAVGMEAGHRNLAGDARDTIVGNQNTFVGNRCAPAVGVDPSYTTGVGAGASLGADYATALGAKTVAAGAGSVAIGADSAGMGAATSTANEIALGTAMHTTKVPGRLNVARRTPTGSADAQGQVGDITSDDSYVYVKTSTGWKRAALAAW